jgi:hypothetical protein
MGATWLLEHLPPRPVLMIDYHRIGDKDATGLFSRTAEEFDWKIGCLKRRFRRS